MELIEKAQAILNNKNFSDQMIATKINVGRMMIHNYRSGATDLNKAKYEVVKSLADEYDKNEIAMIDMAKTGAFKYFAKRMQGWFREAKKDQELIYKSADGYIDDKALVPVIERIDKEVANNTSLLVDLYHIYYKELNKELDK
ncbi:hypothetical protein [Companilactobacillus farciminis]|uniref:hypothetical protein n=1 Tax=Companilactobacillus farciminis TaxID=1612 RepID=UPI00241BEF67|nr:hypothetical protein [Companilactobacillus farciminis]